MSKRKYDCVDTLRAAGISFDDAQALRRIAMTLSRWYELECGMDHGAIERDDKTGKPFFTYDLGDSGKRGRYPIPDREKGAEKRLGAIMARYPDFRAYVQGDPRGASLYVLKPGDWHAGDDLSSIYTRGIAVMK